MSFSPSHNNSSHAAWERERPRFDYSFEVLPRDLSGGGAYQLPSGTRVFLPHFHERSLAFQLAAASELREHGLIPVPHIAARKLATRAELRGRMTEYLNNGVEEFLLLGGDGSASPNGFSTVTEMLDSGIFNNRAIKALGFAGHPEAHPHQSRDVMRQALSEKLARISAQGTASFIVTQFCFTAQPYLDFLDWRHKQAFTTPVRLGLPGAVSAAKLLQLAPQLGWQASFNFSARNFGRAWGLINFSPEILLQELKMQVAARDYVFPVDFHFYPFGALPSTLALMQA